MRGRNASHGLRMHLHLARGASGIMHGLLLLCNGMCACKMSLLPNFSWVQTAGVASPLLPPAWRPTRGKLSGNVPPAPSVLPSPRRRAHSALLHDLWGRSERGPGIERTYLWFSSTVVRDDCTGSVLPVAV
ncbi:hypothetical protein TraAM80_02545 [Trypanosoma rangeli]|uniref:Uncharacterized protein n=1 Tax=Trypanosoma rangeli TaxID=5698 RepID=A0A3R7MNK8_TRYRA|nr:uncharacterized protein TraAM80_02545 [Trypanosoma rangeli]RNF08803.1 hypothetical protein TraAM80_02545 [Trypanosoma rangeli]|eukprot:RNF08803.1 hypothetical protein TraAM80_02545 [Trypanosoma rangeli]